MKILNFVALALLTFSNSSLADPADSDSHVTFESTPQAIVDAFSEALNGGRPFAIPEKIDPPMSGPQSLVWAGSKLESKASAKSSVITFKNAESGDSFEIEVEFSRGIMSVKIPRATTPTFRKGYYLKLSPASSTNEYIVGQGDSGFLISAPRMQPLDWYGFAICPRRLELDPNDKLHRKQLGVITPYQPYAMRTSVTGSCSGKYRSGNSDAEATATILTSPDILPSSDPVERALDRDPEIENEYRPDDSKRDTLKASGVLASGIQSSILLKAPSGQTREKVSRSIIRVETSALTKPFNFSDHGKETSILPGICFVILKQAETAESIK